MNKEAGFTFIEILLVLSAFLVISSIGFAVPVNLIQKQETTQFLNGFQQDILYLQEFNMYEEATAYLTIDPLNSSYSIRKSGSGKIILLRKVPKHVQVDLRTLKQPITYMKNGTIKNPGTMVIKTNTESYKIIFPFGKGRSYIEKQ